MKWREVRNVCELWAERDSEVVGLTLTPADLVELTEDVLAVGGERLVVHLDGPEITTETEEAVGAGASINQFVNPCTLRCCPIAQGEVNLVTVTLRVDDTR